MCLVVILPLRLAGGIGGEEMGSSVLNLRREKTGRFVTYLYFLRLRDF